jgi:hypothetical protein
MSEGQPGARALTLVLEERRKVDERVLDTCRRSLEDVVRLCERIGVRAAIHLGNRPWRAPGPREALALLRDFSGGPVGLVWAPARLAALAAMGLPSSPERHAELRRLAKLVHLSDAVGVHDDLLPGLGECAAEDFDGIDVNLPVILAGRADSSAQEIASAREAVEDRLRQRARSAAS